MDRQDSEKSGPTDRQGDSSRPGTSKQSVRNECTDSDDRKDAGWFHANDGELLLQRLTPLLEAFRGKFGESTRDLVYLGSDEVRRNEATKAWANDRRKISRDRKESQSFVGGDLIHRVRVASGEYLGKNLAQSIGLKDIVENFEGAARVVAMEFQSCSARVLHSVVMAARTSRELEKVPGKGSVEAKGVVVLDVRLGVARTLPQYAKTALEYVEALGREGIGILNTRDTKHPGLLDLMGVRTEADEKFTDILVLAEGLASFPEGVRFREDDPPLEPRFVNMIKKSLGCPDQPDEPRHWKNDVDAQSR